VREERPRKRGGLLVFFLVGALPAAALGWFFLQPEEDRRALLDKIPEGVGGRAVKAAIAFGVLVALASVALPAFHGSSAGLRALLDRFRSRGAVARVLLFPLEALVGLAWLLAQVLFAVDAVLIVAASLALLLLAVRIVKPEFLPGFLPDLGG
jgi:hypothetical protein